MKNYYIKMNKIIPSGVKAMFLTAIVTFALGTPVMAQKIVVGLDNYYNHEIKPNGKSFHYLWADAASSGYSQWGDLFQDKGASLALLKESPSASNLKPFNIFIIVDPDNNKETASPNFVAAKEAKALARWVKKGGILVLLANDSGNCEFTHFNTLAARFGMHFNPVSLLKVTGHNWNMGGLTQLPDHPIFKGIDKIYMKEVSSISLSGRAKPVLEHEGHVLMAECHYGKGTVFAIGDPWIYNEYIDHEHLPADFQNLQAAKNFTDYLLSLSQGK